MDEPAEGESVATGDAIGLARVGVLASGDLAVVAAPVDGDGVIAGGSGATGDAVGRASVGWLASGDRAAVTAGDSAAEGDAAMDGEAPAWMLVAVVSDGEPVTEGDAVVRASVGTLFCDGGAFSAVVDESWPV